MPELPEVEEVRRSLAPRILQQTITAITHCHPVFLTPARAPLRRLVGHRFIQTLRHGKKLFCTLEDLQTLHFHLGMTGNMAVVPRATPLKPHTHFILDLANGTQLRFRDPRRFGGVWYYATLEAALAKEVHERLGPDALVLESAHLVRIWRRATGRLKARLLSQRDVAGLGNIYVDEALWMTRLHPLQRVGRIPAPQLRQLTRAIHGVLNRSLRAGGTTFRDYRNAADQAGQFYRRLKVYGRGGAPCRRCGTPLRSIVAAGRTTVFCPVCQKCR